MYCICIHVFLYLYFVFVCVIVIIFHIVYLLGSNSLEYVSFYTIAHRHLGMLMVIIGTTIIIIIIIPIFIISIIKFYDDYSNDRAYKRGGRWTTKMMTAEKRMITRKMTTKKRIIMTHDS